MSKTSKYHILILLAYVIITIFLIWVCVFMMCSFSTLSHMLGLTIAIAWFMISVITKCFTEFVDFK